VQRNRASRKQAIVLLEKLDAAKQANAEDLFLLVQLYEAVGDQAKARARMLDLLSQGDEPRYLAYCARQLVDRGEVVAARPLIAKLAKLDPQAFSTIELEARALKAENNDRELKTRLQQWLKDHKVDAGRIAGLLEALGHLAEAEELYRKDRESRRPESKLALAAFLGRHGRLADALDECEGALGDCRPEAVAQTSVAILYSGPAGPGDLDRVERLLKALPPQEASQPARLEALAALRNLQGRYDDAEALYRKVLETDTDNLTALNNLAWLLALHSGKPGEALDLVQRAVDAAGELPKLLKTRGVIYLLLDKSALAIADLQEVVAAAPSGSAYFHLARAHHLAHEDRMAKDDWSKAQKLGLASEALHPLERGAYQDLANQLKNVR
jgi:tetratricopeptide (TPR) repeat protein